MTRVYGSCVEPGGMDLDDIVDTHECPECRKSACYRQWEACEGGSINTYSGMYCSHCGYFDGDVPDEPD